MNLALVLAVVFCVVFATGCGCLSVLLKISHSRNRELRDELDTTQNDLVTSLRVADSANMNAEDANRRREEVIKIINEFSTRPATVVMTPEAIQNIGMRIIEFLANSMNAPMSVDFIPKKPDGK